ncbi:hypothetical protein DW209_03150 [Enterobacter hormaechei]|nr:hypothetical protein DW209_03150 [Enterobacter hormaechei]RLZ67451.1 hypothetical protein EA143_00095 [Enterobacter hormaechei]
MFHFHNLHSLSPLRWHPQKNRGIIPLFSDCAIPILLDIHQSKTKKPEARLRLGAGFCRVALTLTRPGHPVGPVSAAPPGNYSCSPLLAITCLYQSNDFFLLRFSVPLPSLSLSTKIKP